MSKRYTTASGAMDMIDNEDGSTTLVLRIRVTKEDAERIAQRLDAGKPVTIELNDPKPRWWHKVIAKNKGG